MQSYDSSGSAKYIAFLIVNFDDSLGEYKAVYFSQIDEYIAKIAPRVDIDIVFYNQRTTFHPNIFMRHAYVVNEMG